MKEIIKYVAEDGEEFYTSEEALSRDALIIKVNSIMSKLSPKPDSCEFSNGGWFIQHDLNDLKEVKNELLELISKYIDHKWVKQTMSEPDAIHPSYVARLIDDYSTPPLRHAWMRLYCTDKLGREWGQPYYVDHPEKSNALKNKE